MRLDFEATPLQQLKADLDVDTVKEILASYLAEAPQLLRQARESWAGKRLADFQRAVHTLKSTSAHVGAVRLSEAAGALEDAAREGRMPAGPAPIDELERLFRVVAPTLRTWSG